MRFALLALCMAVCGCGAVVYPSDATPGDARTDAEWSGAWCFRESVTRNFVCFERGESGRENCEADRLNHANDGASAECAPGLP